MDRITRHNLKVNALRTYQDAQKHCTDEQLHELRKKILIEINKIDSGYYDNNMMSIKDLCFEYIEYLRKIKGNL